jgi:hypothetical protein
VAIEEKVAHTKMRLIYFGEAYRMFIRRVQVSWGGIRKYDGDPKRICNQIIDDCFDDENNYFRTSSGHFCEFYCRDFGWSAESLVSLGYKRQVVMTLERAISIFCRHGKVEQSISPGGTAFTFPNRYSPDALAFLIRALRVLGDRKMVAKYRNFLESEVLRYFKAVIDKKTGLVKKDAHFSSMKDYSVRSSSCYDNAITGMLSNDLDALGLPNPFSNYDYALLLKEYFWKKEYFLDDLSGREEVCGDAQVFPFWTGVVKDKHMLKKAIRSVHTAGLDSPFPLKYSSDALANQSMICLEFFAGDYERDAIWAHVGLLYIQVAAQVNMSLARKLLKKYEDNILLHKNFLEVYDRDGKPFKTLLYYSDEGMIWAANFLALKKMLG